MRTPRQHDIDRAVVRTLSQMGDIPLDEPILADTARRAVAPRALAAEVAASIQDLEARGRLVGDIGDTCTAWKLTAAGRLWWAEHR